MRTLFFGAALMLATPALACPMADAAAFAAAAEKVQAAQGDKVTLAIEGMSCGDCSEKITAKLTSIDGVVAAATDYQTGRAEIAFDGSKVKADALLAAVKEAGYAVKVASKG